MRAGAFAEVYGVPAGIPNPDVGDNLVLLESEHDVDAPAHAAGNAFTNGR